MMMMILIILLLLIIRLCGGDAEVQLPVQFTIRGASLFVSGVSHCHHHFHHHHYHH